MVKISWFRQTERFAPDSKGAIVQDFGSLESAVLGLLWYGHDLKISKKDDNPNIVGLGVDYDIEILDSPDPELDE